MFSLHLYGLLIAAFEKSSYSKNKLDEWLIEMKGNTSFKCWYRVFDLEKDILLLARSLMKSNLLLFYLLFSTLLLFSSHWTMCLLENNPELLREFLRQSFAKSSGPFNGMASYYAHEQHNRDVKAKNGYIDLVNKEARRFLKKLELAVSTTRNLRVH